MEETNYIAGRISGIENENRDCFIEYQSKIFLEMNILASTPHEVCDGKNCIGYNDYMAECVRFLLSDTTKRVFFMTDWALSKGARAEHNLAIIYGKEIHYETY